MVEHAASRPVRFALRSGALAIALTACTTLGTGTGGTGAPSSSQAIMLPSGRSSSETMVAVAHDS
ncbi:MAG: hypothetical protein JWN79_820, partial [Gemmatimonadetes bacterium]|nr:hypothetical protein [Gemmatimonadota bacterium]